MNGLPVVWLTARAAGITAYVLLTLSMLAGLTLKTRPMGRLVSGATAMEVHRSLTLMGLLALAVHGVALVADRTVDIGVVELLVPGTLPYRPVWTAMGVIAAELMLILAISFRLRRRMGMRAWRALHMAAFPTFLLATLHGIFAGTDSGSGWMRWVYVGAVGSVAGGVAFRALTARPAGRSAAARRRVATSTEPSG